jgi:hypothetical protein
MITAPHLHAMVIHFASLLISSKARTGYLGGQLVFKHGAGIELALPDLGDQPKE